MVRDPKDLDGRPLGASSGTSGVRGVGVTGPIWTTIQQERIQRQRRKTTSTAVKQATNVCIAARDGGLAGS